MSKRGVDLGGEFRYLERDYQGTLRAQLHARRPAAPHDRWGYAIKHDGADRHRPAAGRARPAPEPEPRQRRQLLARFLPHHGVADAAPAGQRRLAVVVAAATWSLMRARAEVADAAGRRRRRSCRRTTACRRLVARYTRDDLPRRLRRLRRGRLRRVSRVRTMPLNDCSRTRSAPTRWRRSAGRGRRRAGSSRPKLQLHATQYEFDAPLWPTAQSDRVAHGADLQPGQRPGVRARRQLLRPQLPPDAGAARLLRLHAVSRPEAAAQLRLGAPTTSTSPRSTPRTRSAATTASPTTTCSRWASPRACWTPTPAPRRRASASRSACASRTSASRCRAARRSASGCRTCCSARRSTGCRKWSLGRHGAVQPEDRPLRALDRRGALQPRHYRVVSAAYRLQRGLERADRPRLAVAAQRPVGRQGRGPGPRARRGRGPLVQRGPPELQPAGQAPGRRHRRPRIRRAAAGSAASCSSGCRAARPTSNKRILFQLEFVGFSRLGSNALQALRENIPRYQLLREQVTHAEPLQQLRVDHSMNQRVLRPVAGLRGAALALHCRRRRKACGRRPAGPAVAPRAGQRAPRGRLHRRGGQLRADHQHRGARAHGAASSSSSRSRASRCRRAPSSRGRCWSG